MYIFDVRGNNVFYKEWVTLKASNSKENDTKLMQDQSISITLFRRPYGFEDFSHFGAFFTSSLQGTGKCI
ncbi:unnamed protein product [Hymenolepis diminuta]|uniref:Trafficking protein particle complex subunit n=1 Tax=Hymenolepis diminuta TaxID=6216 RepID=A0A564Y1I2_HYMDI|nr:unnamed protein product [Hymenolepis diminuta]VUZ42715.1 unnamed protein product [Hymenolepis diminuta]VUZ42721.1 unnamed protein product [Hymenolepis diminuta]